MSLPSFAAPSVTDADTAADVRRRAAAPQTLMFDADDTLWENNIYFERAITGFVELLNHPRMTPNEVRAAFLAIEHERVRHFGYGTASFRASMLAGFEQLLSRAPAEAERDHIVALAASIAEAHMELLEGVEETLTELARRHRLILVTKGNLEEQTSKLARSGLAPLFHHVEVLPEKHREAYELLRDKHGCESASTWMIGNSPRSDINPALAAGLHAVFVPHANTWVLEHEELARPQPDRYLLQVERFPQLVRLF